MMNLSLCAHKVQILHHANAQKCTQNSRMDTHMESPFSITVTEERAQMLAHSSGFRSYICAAFHLAHYQDDNLSVAVSRPHSDSLEPITPFTVWAERKEPLLSAGPGLLKKPRHRQSEVWDYKRYGISETVSRLCLVMMMESAIIDESNRKAHRRNSYLSRTLSISNFSKPTPGYEREYIMWQSDDHCLRIRFFHRSQDLLWLVDHHEDWLHIPESLNSFCWMSSFVLSFRRDN